MTTKQLQQIFGATPDGDFGPASVEAAKTWVNRVIDVLEEVEDKFPATGPILRKIPVGNPAAPPPVNPPVVATGAFDERTEKNLATMKPHTQERFRVFLTQARALFPQIVVKVIDGSRTDAQQNALYAQGRQSLAEVNALRRAAGMSPISADENRRTVTNARAGQSNHNGGRAGDIGVFIDGVYQPESRYYDLLGPIGENAGLEWGGRWRFKDSPHFQTK